MDEEKKLDVLSYFFHVLLLHTLHCEPKQVGDAHLGSSFLPSIWILTPRALNI